ncbi:hypothetical protein BX600DRAFT_303330 [Xylariales sp. PMI_506]|nr:hypothetical protein BX600DRAFT_303330 [Xylariales sp. PMI_506]
MERRKIIRSARWGAACALCATAKTRCVRGKDPEAQCDRCRSLEKQCLGQRYAPRKRRQPKSSTNSDSSTALPVERLQQVAELPNSPVEAEAASAHSSLPNNGEGHIVNSYPSSSSPSSLQSQNRQSGTETDLSPPLTGFTPSAPGLPACSCMARLSEEILLPLEPDEVLLETYRNQLSSRFPFVILPANITPGQLQATRPFLMNVIRMVASVRNLQSMRGQSRAIMQHISNAILLRSERSLDLLQGIVVILGYYHYHCMTHAQFNNLIHLAISLIEDLDLSTCPKSQKRRPPLPMTRGNERRSTNNEERRALLGVWYMSSSAALLVKQVAPVKYSRYLNQCLEELETAAEYKTDQLVVQLARIQQLTEKISNFHSRDLVEDEFTEGAAVSTIARLETFEVQLDSLRNMMPQDLKADPLLSCYYNSARIRISEPLLAWAHLPDTEPTSFISPSLSRASLLDVFSQFTAALKTWLENWLTIPVCSYFYMPQPIFTQLTHVAMMIVRWVRLAGPNAFTLSSGGTNMSRKEFSVSQQPIQAFSGVPSCPDLSLDSPAALFPSQGVPAQMFNTLRDQVLSQPDLQVDIYGILGTMEIRFKAAKNEMAAAHGVAWENDMWDLAAEQMKTKKARIEKWCEILTTVANEGSSRMADTHRNDNETTGETGYLFRERSVNGLEWQFPGSYQNNMQWENDLFDDLMRDMHMGAVNNTSGDWNTGREINSC